MSVCLVSAGGEGVSFLLKTNMVNKRVFVAVQTLIL